MNSLGEITAVAQAAVLGVLQGLSEFLPVSSSAHLVILPQLLGWPYLGKAFDVALHFGTLLALVSTFERELQAVYRGTLGSMGLEPEASPEDRRLAQLIAIGSIPVAVLGFLLESVVEEHLGGLLTVACALILGGVLLYRVDRRSVALDREVHQLTARDAVLIGLAQALALIPGISRSGATITTALALRLHRAEAARFSFLLSFPVIAGATIFKALKLGWPGGGTEMLMPVLVGIACAWGSGYLCLRGFLRYLQSASYTPFALYRVGLGIFLIAVVMKA